MATESTDERKQHLRSVTVTSLSALLGVVAAIISSVLTAGMDPTVAAKSQTPQLVVLLAILVQFPLVRLLGFYEDDFGVKDALFIAFMTFSMWFVSWGILLITGASF